MFSRWKNEQAHFSLVTLCVFHVKHLRYALHLAFLSMDPSLSLRMIMELLVPIKPHIPSP